MKSLLTLSVALLALSLLFTSCGMDFDAPVRGNGTIETASRVVGSVDHITLRCDADVTLRPGSNDTILIETDENILPYISTENREGHLTIEVDHSGDCFGVSPTRLKITVYMSDISQLDINGSGSFTSETDTLISENNVYLNINGSGDIDLELTAPKVVTDIDGSGKVYLYGNAETQEATIDGSGTIDNQYLAGKYGTATINGSGTIRMDVSETLKATINGSGSVRYLGNPKVTTKITGSGTVSPL